MNSNSNSTISNLQSITSISNTILSNTNTLSTFTPTAATSQTIQTSSQEVLPRTELNQVIPNTSTAQGSSYSNSSNNSEYSISDGISDGINGNAFASGSGIRLQPLISGSNSLVGEHSRNGTNSKRDTDQEEDEEDEEEVSDASELDDAGRLRAYQQIDQDADKAFAANKKYQDEILAVMRKYAKAIARCSELGLLAEDANRTIERGDDMTLIAPGTHKPSLPWFKHYHEQELAPNPEGQAREFYLNAIKHVPWSQPERNALRDEVINSNKRDISTLGAARKLDVEDALAEHPAAFYISRTGNLDWDKISLAMPRRSAMDCKIQWLQVDHPSINKGKWTSDELKKLYDIAMLKGERDWAGIAAELGTGRNAAECLRRYRQRPGQRRDWTKEEDELLREGVRMFGLNWQSIAHHVGRQPAQCVHRWNKTLNPVIKRGKWTSEEDEALKVAVKACGMSWKHVAGRMKGRTDAQCRERFVNIVDPRLKNVKIWSKEEDAKLYKLRLEGKSWSEIANTFEGSRTDNHCQRRHRIVLKLRKNPPTAAERREIQEARRLKAARVEAGETENSDSGDDSDDDASNSIVQDGEEGEVIEEASDVDMDQAPKKKQKARVSKKRLSDASTTESNSHEDVEVDQQQSNLPIAGPSGERISKRAKLSEKKQAASLQGAYYPTTSKDTVEAGRKSGRDKIGKDYLIFFSKEMEEERMKRRS